VRAVGFAVTSVAPTPKTGGPLSVSGSQRVYDRSRRLTR
jgi:hypothetical protein